MTDADFEVRPAVEGDLPAIHRIYNDEILQGTATWEIAPWPFEQRVVWFRDHEQDPTQPVFAAELAGETVGFSYLSSYRPKIGYRYTRENTVYVAPRFHRRGIGRALLVRLVEEARLQPVHTLVAVIEASNVGSIELHRRLGWVEGGRRTQVGRKFGRWLDSVELQLMLPFEPPAAEGRGD